MGEVLDVELEHAKAEARKEVSCARSQLDLMSDAQRRLELITRENALQERSLLENERDNRYKGATQHIEQAVDLVQDAIAERRWRSVRPRSQEFSALLLAIRDEVENTLNCPELASAVRKRSNERSDYWATRVSREGAIGGSSSWREFRSEFRSLAKQEREALPHEADNELLHASGVYHPGNRGYGDWEVSGSRESFRMDFKALATRVGVALNAPTDVAPLVFWLDCLFAYLLSNQSDHLKYTDKRNGGLLLLLLEASATYCAEIEKAALENEHQLKVNEVPAAKDPAPVAVLIAPSLTDQQIQLLQILATIDGQKGGAEFYLTRSGSPGLGLTYSGGPSGPIANTISDFWELARERLINLAPLRSNQHLGQVTQRGREMARRLAASSVDLPIPESSRHVRGPIDSPAASAEQAPSAEAHKPVLHVEDWKQVEIRFLSDERIQITVGDQTETRSYAEFGLEDARSGKPNLAWQAFRALAESGGNLGRDAVSQPWKDTERRMQELRKILRTHFGLDTDPLPYIPHGGYCAQFKIMCARSFQS